MFWNLLVFLDHQKKDLLKRGNKDVSDTALAIVASMKRDWMQTGRKPGGLCGAALFISALAHGIKCSKHDILKLVHVCEATLTKRLVEFEDTESSSLTIEELNKLATEHEKNPMVMPEGGLKGCISKDLLCQHKNSEVPVSHFALGLCEECYKDFDKLSGGLCGGLDPPAFQRAERERNKKTLAKESGNEACALGNASNDQFKSNKEDFPAYVPESIGANVEHEATKDCKHDDSHREDESETLSDIDDEDIDFYIHDEEGKQIKKILWEAANREYLEEQAAKEAAAAANKKAFEANFENCPEDLLAARELVASSAEAVAKSRKEMKERRANEAKNLRPAQSAAEAFGQMSNKKRHLQSLKSKVNFDRLGELFDEMDKTEDPNKDKKVRFDPSVDNHDNIESKIEEKNENEMGSAEDEVDMGEIYQDTTETMDDKYFPKDDDLGYNEYYY